MDENENAVLEKSYKFALRIVRLYKHLCETKKEFVLSRQMLFTGTAIGEHVKGAQEVDSRTDFFHEMSSGLKMASKNEYWLELLRDGEFLDAKEFTSIHTDCVELIKLLKSITKPTRRAKTN
ncbi:MAG: four helix bundle protein [Blastocatellia bacterium]